MRELFTPEEDAFLRLNYKSMTYEAMAHEIYKVSGIKRPQHAIKGRMYRMRIRKNPAPRLMWSVDEEDYLWELHQRCGATRMTTLINARFGQERQRYAVVAKLCKLKAIHNPKVSSAPIYKKPIYIEPISITRRSLIQALDHIDETAYTLASIIRRLTKWSMTADGVVQMMTVTGMPVRYATPEVKEFLNIK